LTGSSACIGVCFVILSTDWVVGQIAVASLAGASVFERRNVIADGQASITISLVIRATNWVKISRTVTGSFRGLVVLAIGIRGATLLVVANGDASAARMAAVKVSGVVSATDFFRSFVAVAAAGESFLAFSIANLK